MVPTSASMFDPQTCSICDEINGEMPLTFQRMCKMRRRIVIETASFVVLPSVSPLAEGHVMIVPRHHISAMLNVSSARAEFLDLSDTVHALVSTVYGPSVVFEHGVGAGKRGGCGIDHAHVHILPLRPELATIVYDALAAEYGAQAPTSIAQAFDCHDASHSYLLFGTARANTVVHYSEALPSQYLRHLVARLTGQPQRHWRELFAWDAFSDTFARLKSALR